METKLKPLKYMAIRVKGFDYWLWFATEDTSVESGTFTGKGGWGNGGAFTEIEVSTSDITGRISSDMPQYR